MHEQPATRVVETEIVMLRTKRKAMYFVNETAARAWFAGSKEDAATLYRCAFIEGELHYLHPPLKYLANNFL